MRYGLTNNEIITHLAPVFIPMNGKTLADVAAALPGAVVTYEHNHLSFLTHGLLNIVAGSDYLRVVPLPYAGKEDRLHISRWAQDYHAAARRLASAVTSVTTEGIDHE